MKVTDYIVSFLIEKGITDVFGYPGGMVTHLMDSLEKQSSRISAHVNYHEQGAAFAACGYAQASERMGVAYATSGPGATNLITGIANAYFDSIPVLFITGQVNTFECKQDLGIRQRGFQETDIVDMVSGITKMAIRIERTDQITSCINQAWEIAMTGRKGPVLIDIPMDIQRGDISISPYIKEEKKCHKSKYCREEIVSLIRDSKRPCFVAGAGLKGERDRKLFREIAHKLQIPVVTSMPGIGVIESDDRLNCGFLGAYGERCANFVLAKSDLVIAIGTRLDIRQTGAIRENFAPNAKLIRIDIDKDELNYHVRGNEITILCAAQEFLTNLANDFGENRNNRLDWLDVCKRLQNVLRGRDNDKANCMVEKISQYTKEKCIITTDVGQNQIWVAQSFRLQKNQQILFSSGHGAMGYSLPAAIGAYYGTGLPVISFNGDGGIQMNIQELQFIARENLPIQIIIFNNYALGMIRHFQEMYFDSRYVQTTNQGGYTVPSFQKLATAYGIQYRKVLKEEDITTDIFDWSSPRIIEVQISEPTYVFPKLEYGKPNQDQEPLLDRDLYEELMKW